MANLVLDDKNIKKFEENIGYTFKNKSLLITAITHSSFANEGIGNLNNNERLEFLGDSVLNLCIGDYIYNNEIDMPEGEMTKIRAAIVCEQSLKEVAMKLELGTYLRLGKGEEANHGRTRPSILADAFEALIGAVYLDSDFNTVKEFIYRNMESIIEGALTGTVFNDYKTELQECLQRQGNVKIKYVVEKQSGPDHQKIYNVSVYINNVKCGSGIGTTKKEGEQNAAKEALLKGIKI
ncbi:MAG: ribonuclease III [Clostridia bacterium]|jgi:ribonuclease-3|nr:ribonuclease III [Clostridiaceae bacterium]